MKNKENIKNTFSNIRPSDECIERVFDMTVDKKANKSLTLKRIASVALAFALIIGGGFGHGVGMSQNGAKNMALQGLGAEQILNFFYEGCEICSEQ